MNSYANISRRRHGILKFSSALVPLVHISQFQCYLWLQGGNTAIKAKKMLKEKKANGCTAAVCKFRREVENFHLSSN